MKDLDSAVLNNVDIANAYRRNLNLGTQCQSALRAFDNPSILPTSHSDIDKVLIAGMGGSAIAGDFVKALAMHTGRFPVEVIRGYDLPCWVDCRTLVICCSHSGDTEEVLSVARQALDKGAKVTAVTTGGALWDLAQRSDIPLLSYEFAPEPRSAFGHQFIRLLAIANSVGLLAIDNEQLREACADLQEWSPNLSIECAVSRNPAKQIAHRLRNKIPVIVSSEHLAPAARRWKTQLNENAKVFSTFEELPELHHNGVEGLALPAELKTKMIVILLQMSDFSLPTRMRFMLTRRLLGELGIEVLDLDLSSRTRIAAILKAVLLGNMVSFYLAILTDVAPYEISAIQRLKTWLRSASVLS